MTKTLPFLAGVVLVVLGALPLGWLVKFVPKAAADAFSAATCLVNHHAAPSFVGSGWCCKPAATTSRLGECLPVSRAYQCWHCIESDPGTSIILPSPPSATNEVVSAQAFYAPISKATSKTRDQSLLVANPSHCSDDGSLSGSHSPETGFSRMDTPSTTHKNSLPRESSIPLARAGGYLILSSISSSKILSMAEVCSKILTVDVMNRMTDKAGLGYYTPEDLAQTFAILSDFVWVDS